MATGNGHGAGQLRWCSVVCCRKSPLWSGYRVFQEEGLEGSGHSAKTGCRLGCGGEAGYIISGRSLLSGKVAVQGLSSGQWARWLVPLGTSANRLGGPWETAAKRKICAIIFNDIPTRPHTLTIKKSTTTPLLHRKIRGLDIAWHPE